VSGMGGQLRDLLDAAVGEPPRRVTVQAVRRRAARRRMAERVSAAVAVLLLVGLGGAVSATVTGPGPASSLPGPGVPRYYVEQGFRNASPAVTMVRATATGAVTATLGCPWPGAQISTGEIAAVGNQTFFVICQKVAGPGASVTGSRIYRFHLTASGRITGYSLVPGGSLDGLGVTGIAASADGSEIAVSTVPGGSASPSVSANLVVINTRTGARAVWQATPAVPGQMGFDVSDPSLTANGRELVYLAVPHCSRGRCKSTGNGEEVRALSPAAEGGQISSSRILVRQSALVPLSTGYLDGAVVSPDGSSVNVLEMVSPLHPGTTVSVVQVSAATGRPERVRYQVDTGNGFMFRFFSSDPSGRYLLLDAGPTSGPANGWIDNGRLIPLTPAKGNNVFYESW
jgi:hypothetical protein